MLSMNDTATDTRTCLGLQLMEKPAAIDNLGANSQRKQKTILLGKICLVVHWG